MSHPIQAELIMTGSELMDGRTRDVNGPFLARGLARLGIHCRRIMLLGDDAAALQGQLTASLKTADLIIVSGGLGPTEDDLTRPVLAATLDRELVTGATLPDHKPSPVPQGSEFINNPNGQAAGLWIIEQNSLLLALPGPPHELRSMWPALSRRLGQHFLAAPTPFSTTLRLVGLTERQAERFLQDALAPYPPDLSVGITAKPLRVDVHLASLDAPLFERSHAAAQAVLARYIYGTGDARLAQVVGTALRDQGLTVATAESCTGGGICAALTAVPGASDYVDRAVVSYSNAAKVEALGVPNALIERHGAVSEAVASAMAEGLKSRSNADLTVAVTGIAGPDGGSAEKPVGLVIMALSDGEATFCRRFHHYGDRQAVIERSVTRGLDLLRRYLGGGMAALEAHYPITR